MGLLKIEGFEGWNNPETFFFGSSAGSFSISVGGGRFGGNALVNSLSGGGQHIVLIPSLSNPYIISGITSYSVVVGFAYKFSPGGKDTIVMRWQGQYPDGSVPYDQVVLRKDANDILCLYSNGANIARGTHPLQSNRYYYIEWKVTIRQLLTGATWGLEPCLASSNEIRLDGVVEAVVPTSTQVGYTGTTSLGTFVNGGYIDPGTSTTVGVPWMLNLLRLEYDQFQLHQWFDDIYALDSTGTYNNDYLNDCTIDKVIVNGDGTPDQWTAVGSVSKFGAVDEAEPDGDNSYVMASSIGQAQTFTVPAIKTNSIAVFGVQASAILRKSDLAPRTVAFLGNAPTGVATTIGTVIAATTTDLVVFYNGRIPEKS